MADEDRAWIVASDGTVKNAPVRQLDGLSRQGWQLASNEQVDAHIAELDAKEAATSGVLNQINTGVEAVARAATLGGADWLAAKFTPEVVKDVKARSETDLAQGTELAATVGLTLLSGGGLGAAKAAAKGGAMATEALLAKAGQEATKAALRRTPLALANRGGALANQGVQRGVTALAGEGALARGSAKILGAGAEGAVDAAAMQVADNVSEASLGEQEITAERLLANLPESMLLGAQLGGGLASVGKLAELGVKAGKAGTRALSHAADSEAVNALGELLPGPLGKAARSASTLGKVGKALTDEGDGSILGRIGEKLSKGDEIASKAFSTPSLRQDVARRDAVLDEITTELGPKIERAVAAQAERRAIANEAADITQVASQVRRGPEVWKAAQPELLSLHQDLAQIGGLKGLRPATRGAVKRVVTDLADAAKRGDEADAFLALNNAKAVFATAAQKEGSALGAELSGRVAQRLDGLLTNEDVWGAAARLQKARKAADDDAANNVFLAKIAPDGKVDPKRLRALVSASRHDGDFQTKLLRELETEELALAEQAASGPTAARERAARALEETRDAKAKVGLQLGRVNDVNALHRLQMSEASSLLGGQGLAEMALGGLMGGAPGAAASLAVNILSRPGTLASKLGTVENLWQQVQRQDGAVKALADRVVSAGTAARKGVQFAKDSLVPVVATVGGAQSAQDRRRDVEKKMKLLEKAAADPQLIMAQVGRLTDGMDEAAPGTQATIAAKYARTIGHLASKLPTKPESGDIQQHSAMVAPIPDSEIRAMSDRIQAATTPRAIFEGLARGEVSPEAVETLQQTWPAYTQDFSAKVIEGLANATEPASYDQLLKVSAVTSVPAVATMQPWFIAAQQGMHRQRAAERAQAAKQPPAAKPPDVASAAMTDSEKALANL
jgi:hypothetical protein